MERLLTSISNVDLGFAFSGWVDIHKALDEIRRVYGRLSGLKILTIVGGNVQREQELTRAIDRGTFRGYRGLAFDGEVGHSCLSRLFKKAFHSAKRTGLIVVVTVPHIAPYRILNRTNVIRSLITSRYVDVLPLMLYASSPEHRECSQRGDVDTRAEQGLPWLWFRLSLVLSKC